MATYTKETALYDTGAIASDIEEAGKTADRYITAVDQSGIKVHAANNVNSNYAKINADGMEVFKGGTSIASFGSDVRIGPDGNSGSHIIIDSDSIELYKDGIDNVKVSGNTSSGFQTGQLSFLTNAFANGEYCHLMGGRQNENESTASQIQLAAYARGEQGGASVMAHSSNIDGQAYVDVSPNFRINNTPVADFIIEQGTDGIWTYRKWNSGIAECWGVELKSTAISSNWNGLYYSSELGTDFPTGFFVDVPTTVSIYVSGALSVWAYNSTTFTKDTIKYYLTRPAQVTTGNNFNIRFHAIGRWK